MVGVPKHLSYSLLLACRSVFCSGKVDTGSGNFQQKVCFCEGSGEDPTMALEEGNGFINVGLLVAFIHIHFVIEVAGFGGK